jgi:hypothetical protein
MFARSRETSHCSLQSAINSSQGPICSVPRHLFNTSSNGTWVRAREVPFNVEHLAEKLRTAGFVVEAGVEIGEVRSTIIDCAANWGADLIVIGSHGHKGLVRLLLGSVAESVVRHAACSVLVVRQSPSKP